MKTWTPTRLNNGEGSTGRGQAFHACEINYADDFVTLSRDSAARALDWTRLGLTLNEAKTSIKDGRREQFHLPEYTFGPHRYRKDGHWYLGASPSEEEREPDEAGRAALSATTAQSGLGGNGALLRRRGFRVVGSASLASCQSGSASVGLTLKTVGEPDAGNPHVRFDERGRETGPRCASAPRPSSTLLKVPRFFSSPALQPGSPAHSDALGWSGLGSRNQEIFSPLQVLRTPL